MNLQSSEKTYSAFCPVLLIAASVIILLAWNLNQMLAVHSNGVRINAQLEAQMGQAAQTEERLRVMMADLVELAKSDTDAETIIKRYKIAFSAPPKGTAPAAPAP